MPKRKKMRSTPSLREPLVDRGNVENAIEVVDLVVN